MTPVTLVLASVILLCVWRLLSVLEAVGLLFWQYVSIQLLVISGCVYALLRSGSC